MEVMKNCIYDEAINHNCVKAKGNVTRSPVLCGGTKSSYEPGYLTACLTTDYPGKFFYIYF
jgi:hypothetical protein